MSEPAQGSFTLGNVFSRGFGIMSGAAAAVFGISFLFAAVPQAIWSVVFPTFLQGAGQGSLGLTMVVMAVGILILVTCGLLTQGALVRAALNHAEGRPTSIGDALGTGFAMILPLLGLGILMTIGLSIGMLLLVVPGIILFLMWSVAAPALIDESTGIIGALGRSRELTKGFRWKIFGFFLVLVAIVWVTIIVFGLALFASGSAGMYADGPAMPSTSAIIFGLAVNTLLAGAWSSMTNALFIELRNAKEGLAPDNLAEVFA